MAFPRNKKTPQETQKRKTWWGEAMTAAVAAHAIGAKELEAEFLQLARVLDSWKGNLPPQATVLETLQKLDDARARLELAKQR